LWVGSVRHLPPKNILGIPDSSWHKKKNVDCVRNQEFSIVVSWGKLYFMFSFSIPLQYANNSWGLPNQSPGNMKQLFIQTILLSLLNFTWLCQLLSSWFLFFFGFNFAYLFCTILYQSPQFWGWEGMIDIPYLSLLFSGQSNVIFREVYNMNV